MSDHVDGPRSIGDPSADLTDLFAFTSPEHHTRTVLAACVFPSAGEGAIFSNIIDYSIVVRRVTVAGVGDAAKFQPADDEIRFSFRFEVLQRDAAGHVIQRGVCTLPDRRKLSVTVNDENGASTPEGDVRVFERLEAIDNVRRCVRYTNIAGMPVSHYTGMLEVKPKGGGCVVEWRVHFLANHQTDRAVKSMVSTLLTRGLEGQKPRFGVMYGMKHTPRVQDTTIGSNAPRP